MGVCNVRLFILDISGYTRFLVNTDLVHGEETITNILNRLSRFSQHGLVLNKVEGDALFFFTTELSKENLCQLSKNIYIIFKQDILASVAQKHASCPFTLCRHINDLSIKFFIHEGEVAFHHINNFQEIIGKSVIEIHRVMKNSINSDSYILTINQKGQYSDKYKFIGKIIYDIVYLDKNNGFLNYFKRFLHRTHRII